MKLSEAQLQLFHGSWQPLEIGKVYRARLWKTDTSGMGHNVEKILEIYRPPSAVPRKRAFFLVDDDSFVSVAGGADTYVYQVQSVGRITRHDQGWLGDLADVIAGDKADRKRVRPKKAYKDLAEQYWTGKRYLTSEWSLWEYLTPSFRVVKLVYEREF